MIGACQTTEHQIQLTDESLYGIIIGVQERKFI